MLATVQRGVAPSCRPMEAAADWGQEVPTVHPRMSGTSACATGAAGTPGTAPAGAHRPENRVACVAPALPTWPAGDQWVSVRAGTGGDSRHRERCCGQQRGASDPPLRPPPPPPALPMLPRLQLRRRGRLPRGPNLRTRTCGVWKRRGRVSAAGRRASIEVAGRPPQCRGGRGDGWSCTWPLRSLWPHRRAASSLRRCARRCPGRTRGGTQQRRVARRGNGGRGRSRRTKAGRPVAEERAINRAGHVPSP